MAGWAWVTGTPNERARAVRAHHRLTPPLAREALRDLFCLTDGGLAAIIHGGDWRPEYQAATAADAPPKPKPTRKGPKGCFQWTDKRLAVLRELWSDGWSAQQIANKLGNPSRNSVIGKVHRLGLMQPRGKRKAQTTRPHDQGGGTIQRIRNKAVSKERATKDWGIRQRLMDKAGRNSGPDPQKPLPQPPEAFSDRAPLNLTLLELTNATCKWPHGDEAPFEYCGHETFGFQPYCPFHQRRSRSPRGLAA